MPAYNPRPAFVRPVFCAGIVLLGLQLAGCATLRVADQLDRSLAAEDYAAGLAAIEQAKNEYAGSNSLLYYLDQGSLEQRAGDYASSNAALEQAELLSEQLATASISETAASLLVNDTTLSYSGEDYERVAINILKTLNYLYLGDAAGAQVEARKVNERLLTLSDKYGQEAVYKEDAFARYLSAFAYEAAGAYNDAYIDYKKALAGLQWYQRHYGQPVLPQIRDDLLRLSRWLGFDDEYQEWREQFGEEAAVPPRRPAPRSEVLLVVYDGLLPAKRTRFIETVVKDPDGQAHVLKVAFPAFKPRLPALERCELEQEDGNSLPAWSLEPLAHIAEQNLEQRIGLISVKAIARATTKFLAAYQVRKAAHSGNQGVNLLVGLATDIYNVVSEQADTRSWRTLPYRFWVLRLSLPPGVHTLTIAWEPLKSGELRRRTLTVELQPGQKKVLPLYVPK